MIEDRIVSLDNWLLLLVVGVLIHRFTWVHTGPKINKRCKDISWANKFSELRKINKYKYVLCIMYYLLILPILWWIFFNTGGWVIVKWVIKSSPQISSKGAVCHLALAVEGSCRGAAFSTDLIDICEYIKRMSTCYKMLRGFELLHNNNVYGCIYHK